MIVIVAYLECDLCKKRVEIDQSISEGMALRNIEAIGWWVRRTCKDITYGQAKCPNCK